MADPTGLTHHIHYAGVSMKVTYAQASYVVQAMRAAQAGETRILVLEGVSLGFGDPTTNYMLVGPGVPVHVQGPTITEISD